MYILLYTLVHVSAYVLSTYVLSAYVLSTYVLSTYMLSTYVLSAYVLSTYVLSTYVLSTYVISTYVLSTYVLSTYVFSTYVLSALHGALLDSSRLCCDLPSLQVRWCIRKDTGLVLSGLTLSTPDVHPESITRITFWSLSLIRGHNDLRSARTSRD